MFIVLALCYMRSINQFNVTVNISHIKSHPLENINFNRPSPAKNKFQKGGMHVSIYYLQGWFTPGIPELSAWQRSFFPSTNVISDTGQVPRYMSLFHVHNLKKYILSGR